MLKNLPIQLPSGETLPGASKNEGGIGFHTYDNGTLVTAQDTVPFVLWCAAQHLDDYPEALWLTASGLGDVDTTCAMVGGIVASFTGMAGIPPEWQAQREPLPQWPFVGE